MKPDLNYLDSLINDTEKNKEGWTVTELVEEFAHTRLWWGIRIKKLMKVGMCKCVGFKVGKCVGYEFSGKTFEALAYSFKEKKKKGK